MLKALSYTEHYRRPKGLRFGQLIVLQNLARKNAESQRHGSGRSKAAQEALIVRFLEGFEFRLITAAEMTTH